MNHIPQEISYHMSNSQNHWLIAGRVYGVNSKGLKIEEDFNVLTLTDRVYLTRKDLMRAQNALQARFMALTSGKFKPTNVVILMLTSMGCMHPGVFNEGFVDTADQLDKELKKDREAV